MGKGPATGDTRVTGTFRPKTNGADFTVKTAIENTQMAAMSDLFRAFGNFDVKQGLFSVYAELTVKDEAINGYVKPLFRDLKKQWAIPREVRRPSNSSVSKLRANNRGTGTISLSAFLLPPTHRDDSLSPFDHRSGVEGLAT